VIITATTTAEADLLSRRLPALRHLFGQDVEIQTPGLQGHRLPELLGSKLAVADLERCYASGPKGDA
jgi:hypothetical protein